MAGDGITLNVLDHGAGSPILLLHGFPDSARMWRNQIPALVEAGHRVIAPDLRGFGDTEKPQKASAYAMRLVLSDLLKILGDLGINRADVVGHDWGAIAAWGLAGWHPDRVRRLIVVSVGHPRAFVFPSPPQAARSWYALVFQIPGLTERLFTARDWALFRRLFGGSPDFDRYMTDLKRPGALTAGLNWYRANGKPYRLARYPRVQAPTLGLWGTRDWSLGERQMKRSKKYVDGPWHYERIEAGHWLPLSRPEIVNRQLLDFLQ